jgi:D-alanyl-D-alanine carboxypeptidase
MKKVVCFFIAFVSIFTSKSDESYEQYVNRSYIVMDASNNNVIEGKNINLARNVASVSKIMTAIVAIENGDLNRKIVILKEDLDTYGSSIYLKEGNSITLEDLLYGLMLRSGNDAALAIARSVSGSVENFVKMMNEKASEIGMNNSMFNNPSGLDANEEGNISTSYDLALLMSYSLKSDLFRKIISTKVYKSEIGTWKNKNKLLHNYKYSLGGKTGFTDKAKRTLVTASKQDDTTFIVVTLDCGNDFNFHKFLYEKNFDLYKSFKVLNSGENYIEEYVVTCKSDIYVTLNKEEMEMYSLLYKMRDGYAKVYLKSDHESKEIGACSVSENKNIYKKNFIDKIKYFFTFR